MLSVATVNHHTASLDVREKISVADNELDDLLVRVQRHLGPTAIISTCNRLEFYTTGTENPEQLTTYLQQETHMNETEVQDYFRIYQGESAVRHLYRVSSGLESLVIGEAEILGQVRTAFAHAADSGVDDSMLVRLFHGAIRAGRRVRSETSIGHRSVSVSSIAVQKIRDHHNDLQKAKVLIIGAGEAARLIAESLVEQDVSQIYVANRTQSRAESLAKELDGIAVQYSNLMEVVNDVDVVITATEAPGTLINFEEMNKTIQLRQNTPLLIMDIGLPRDVEPRISDLPNVTYFDMEALQEIAAENGKARAQEIGAAEHLIEEELKEFSVWLENLQTQPTIASLSARSEKIRKDAVEKSLQRLHLDEAQQDEIDALTRAIVKRILHDPIVALREYGNQDTHYVEVVHKLFGLNDEFSSLTDLSVSEQPEDDRL